MDYEMLPWHVFKNPNSDTDLKEMSAIILLVQN